MMKIRYKENHTAYVQMLICDIQMRNIRDVDICFMGQIVYSFKY